MRTADQPAAPSARIGRNLKFMSAGVLGSALLQYGLYFWIARYLGIQAYGAFSIALTVAVLAAPLCDLGMSVSLVRTCSRRPDSLPEVLGACVLWRALLSLPVGLAGFAACALAGYSAGVLWLFVPLYLAAVCDGVCTLCSAVFQAREEMSRSSTILLGRNLMRAAALTTAVLTGSGPETIAMAFLAASAVGAAASWSMVRRRTSVSYVWSGMGGVMKESLPFGLAIIAVLLHMQVDVAMLGQMRGESEVGLYHAGMRFIVLAQMVPQTIAMVTAPRAYRIGLRGTVASSGFYRVQATALAMLGLVGSLVLALHGEFLVRLGLGSRYDGAAVLVIAVAPVMFIKFLSSPLGDALASIGRQHRLTIGYWLALAVNVVANLFLIPARGASGAVIATIVSESSLLAFLVITATTSGLHLRWASVMRHPLIVAVAALILFFASLALMPRSAQPLVLPLAVLVYAWLVWRRPTEEERVLLGRQEAPA